MRVKNKTINIVLHIFFIIFCVLCIIPVLMALSASFSSEGAIVSHGYSILPKEISLDGYKYVFSNPLFDTFRIRNDYSNRCGGRVFWCVLASNVRICYIQKGL